jgi:hypothetical protein
MATNKQKMIGVCVNDELADLIDNFRRGERDLPPKGEAVRRLVKIGLAHCKDRVQLAEAAHREA